jgi:hypothetical protein
LVHTDPLTAKTCSYVNGDPVNLTGPNGHWACDDSPNSWRHCSSALQHRDYLFRSAEVQPFSAPCSGCVVTRNEAGLVVAAPTSHGRNVTSEYIQQWGSPEEKQVIAYSDRCYEELALCYAASVLLNGGLSDSLCKRS